ncbi:MAG: hypothetical protein R6V58_15225 [Planctomycetota bacterium]
MRALLILLLAAVPLGAAAGCDTMPEEAPGYHVRHRPRAAPSPGWRGAAIPNDRSARPRT